MKEIKKRNISKITYGDMKISGSSLGISSRNDSVDKKKGTNNLSTQTSAFAVAIRYHICTPLVSVKIALLKSLH